MAQGSPLDPNWLPAPQEDADTGRALRLAEFKRHAAFDTDPSVVAAIEQAAGWSVLEALARCLSAKRGSATMRAPQVSAIPVLLPPEIQGRC